MPAAEPARTTEAIRRLLPELLRLNRYERRAAARRDRAIRALTQNEIYRRQWAMLAKRSQFPF